MNKQPDLEYHDIEELEQVDSHRKASQSKRNRQQSQPTQGNEVNHYVQGIKERAGDFYDRALDWQIKLEPCIIGWLIATFLIETIRFDKGAFFFGVLIACGMAYMGIKALRTKNQRLIVIWCVLMGITCIIHLFDSFRSKRGRPWSLVTFLLEIGLCCFELFLIYVIVRIEILMGKADTLRDVFPERANQNATEPNETEFNNGNGRKNTVYSEK